MRQEKFDLNRGLKKLYNEPMNFKVQEAHDLACFFNLEEFAEVHDIDGHKIIGVFTSDQYARRFQQTGFSQDNIQGVSRSYGLLFLRTQDVGNVKAEQPLRLDGKLYRVEEAVKLGKEIWRLSLSANEG